MASVNTPAASRIHRLSDGTDGTVAACVRGPRCRDTARVRWINLCDASISTASSARKRWYPPSYTLPPAPCHRRRLDDKVRSDPRREHPSNDLGIRCRPQGTLTDLQHRSDVTCQTCSDTSCDEKIPRNLSGSGGEEAPPPCG